MDEMLTTLKDLLTALWSEQNKSWAMGAGSNRASTQALDAFRKVASLAPYANHLKREELHAKLPTPDKLASDFGSMKLLLPPIRRASRFVPLLWMKYDLRTTPAAIGLHVTLFCLDQTELKAIGFRLENGEGAHEFYHAQIVSDLGSSDVAHQLLCPAWIPDSQPSFPLPADCPVSLILCLILTLYGLKEAARMCTVHTIHKLQPYITKLEPYVKLLAADDDQDAGSAKLSKKGGKRRK
jgi:hypothetical protein